MYLITCSAYVAARCIRYTTRSIPYAAPVSSNHFQAVSSKHWDNDDVSNLTLSVNVRFPNFMAGRHASFRYTSLLTTFLRATPSNKPCILSLPMVRSATRYAQPSTVDCSPTLRLLYELLWCNWWWRLDLFMNIVMKVTFSKVLEVREVFHGYPPNFFYTKCDEIRWE